MNLILAMININEVNKYLCKNHININLLDFRCNVLFIHLRLPQLFQFIILFIIYTITKKFNIHIN